jgi:pSer/pThr/pTyr-binding forkhead associated (FHA) protein
MELTIKLLSGRNSGKEVKIPVNKFLIGRADDCHLRPHSDMVSRHHCVLLTEEGFCAIRDFGSRNGTFLNDEQVVGQRELRNGDRIKVGNLEFEIQLTSSVGGKKRPKVKDVKDAAVRTAAGSAPAKDDGDISDWLTIDESSGESQRAGRHESKRPAHETPAVSMTNRETTFLKTPTDETTTVPAVDKTDNKPEEAGAEIAPRGAEAGKRLFGGKIVVPPKDPPKNSHEAATQALKKLFNSRKT